jgi:hypothetical protein
MISLHNKLWREPVTQIRDSVYGRILTSLLQEKIEDAIWRPVGDTVWDAVGRNILNEALIIRPAVLNVMRFLNIKYI